MSTNLDDVIREAAEKNGVGLLKDDPIMVLITIMNRIISDQKDGLNKQQAALLVEFAEKIEETLQRVTSDSQENMVSSVNAVANYAKDILPKVLTAGTKEAVKTAKNELGTMMHDFHCSVALFKQWAFAATVAVSVSAAIGVLLVFVQIIVALSA